MRSLILLFLMLALSASAATSFTEFYVQSGGNNLNAGSTVDNNANYTGVGDSDGTSVFTPSDGSTPSTTVSNGSWGSVYVTSGATVAVYVGLVTNVAAGANGAVTFSQVAKAGTFPAASAGAHTITLKTGGSWLGPNGAVNFPFGFVTTALTNSSQNVCRVNLNGTNTVTAAVTHANVGPIRWQGYTNSPGDGGKWTLNDTATSASYTLFTINANNNDFIDLIFYTQFTSGTSDGFVISQNETLLERCVIHGIRASGFLMNNSGGNYLIECEAYDCDKGNNATKGGFGLGSANGVFVRCFSHHNTNANACGFAGGGGGIFVNCIAATNGASGILYSGTATMLVKNCDLYANGASGIDLSGATAALISIQNCNFVKNGAYGINSSGSLLQRNGNIINCGFGSGTQANSTADIVAGLQGMNQSGSFSYAANVTPWTDPVNGDFRINLAAARAAGRGSFTETYSGYTGTIAYPDVGAAQSITNSGGGGPTSYTVSQ